MADVQRLVSTLVGLLPSSGAGDISAQDLRDFLVSAAAKYGHLYVSTSGATTVASGGVYYEAAGTFTLAQASGWSKGADNRLRYDGAPTYEAKVAIHGTITCASSTQALRVGIGKNGSIVTGAEVSMAIGTTGTDAIPFSISAVVEVATNDYLGIMVRNDTGANNVTLTYGAIVVQSWMK